MSSSVRVERVAHVIQAAVANLLIRGALKDPRIGFITITGVKVSADLSVAQVFYSMLGSEAQRNETQKALNSAKGFVRRALTRQVQLRTSPEVFFTLDKSIEYGEKIERLLQEVRSKEGW